MADLLPIEIITHILSFLGASDRKQASLVCHRWLLGSRDSVLMKDVTVRLTGNEQENFVALLRRSPNVVIDSDTKIGEVLRNNILNQCQLKSLTLKGSDITPKLFGALLPFCSLIRKLNISNCNALFMSGQLLQDERERQKLRQCLENLREVDVSANRYMSDVSFTRLLEIIPVLESLAMSGCKFVFLSDYITSRQEACRTNSSILSFDCFLTCLTARAAELTSLDLCNTGLTDQALRRLAAVPGLSLQALHLRLCADVQDDSVVPLIRSQGALRRLTLAHSDGLTDGAVSAAQTHLEHLHTLDIRGLRQLRLSNVHPLSKWRHLKSLTMDNCYRFMCEDDLHSLVSISLSCVTEVRDTHVVKLCQHCPLLERLNLASTGITDVSVRAIQRYLPRLKSLSYAWCKKVTDYGLLDCSTSEELQQVHRLLDADHDTCRCQQRQQPRQNQQPAPHVCAAHALLPTDQPEGTFTLRNLSHLQTLDLTSCSHVTDKSICTTLRHPDLRGLSLTLCPGVTDKGVQAIADGAPLLETLSLAQCSKVTDASLQTLARKARRMTSLNVSSCDLVTRRTLEALMTYSWSLRELDVSLCAGVSVESVETAERSLPCLRRVNKHLTGIAT